MLMASLLVADLIFSDRTLTQLCCDYYSILFYSYRDIVPRETDHYGLDS